MSRFKTLVNLTLNSLLIFSTGLLKNMILKQICPMTSIKKKIESSLWEPLSIFLPSKLELNSTPRNFIKLIQKLLQNYSKSHLFFIKYIFWDQGIELKSYRRGGSYSIHSSSKSIQPKIPQNPGKLNLWFRCKIIWRHISWTRLEKGPSASNIISRRHEWSKWRCWSSIYLKLYSNNNESARREHKRNDYLCV